MLRPRLAERFRRSRSARAPQCWHRAIELGQAFPGSLSVKTACLASAPLPSCTFCRWAEG